MVNASNTWVGSRRGTVSTWSYTQRWSYPSASASCASSTDRAQASGPLQPVYSSFQPWGMKTPTCNGRSPADAEAHAANSHHCTSHIMGSRYLT